MKRKTAQCHLKKILAEMNRAREEEGLPKIRMIDLFKHVGVTKQAGNLWMHPNVKRRVFPSDEHKNVILAFVNRTEDEVWTDIKIRPLKSLDLSKNKR